MARNETKALEKLESQRRSFEERLSEVRRATDRELGLWAPRRAIWALPAVAFACALVLVVGRRRKKRDS